jgi:hypothetical protein
VALVPDENAHCGEPVVGSFAWTSSRATHTYYVHHAPVEELLGLPV